jgi:trk system potassium uptake protein TrkA
VAAYFVSKNLVRQEAATVMRVVLIGASQVTIRAAELFIKRNYEVVIIETDRGRIDALSQELDCSFLHGDGSKPNILKEAGPKQSQFLFCLTDNDQNNIIASLVGRSLGYTRVVTRIQDPSFEPICLELGLENIIIPSRTIARYLVDMVAGVGIPDISTVLKGEARLFSFIVSEGEAGAISGLDLPQGARVICYYRDDTFYLPKDDTSLVAQDEVVILTYSDNLAALQERFKPKAAEKSPEKLDEPEREY